jgi:hypothetical protein
MTEFKNTNQFKGLVIWALEFGTYLGFGIWNLGFNRLEHD